MRSIGCSLAKVRNEPRSFVDELTIEGAATGSEFLGVLFPFRNLIRLDAPEVQEMRVQHGSDELFEVPLRNGRIRIFERDDLALFSDAKSSPGGSEGLRLDAAVGLPSSTVNRPTLAVKQTQANAVFLRHAGQLLLRTEKRPVGCNVTSVLDRVGIPQHDLLKFLARTQNAPIEGVREKLLHDSRTSFQIVEGLE